MPGTGARGITGLVGTLWKRREVRFLVAGGWNTAFSYAVFAALVVVFGRPDASGGASLADLVRNDLLLAISYVIGITMSYTTFKIFVFRTKGNYVAEYLRSIVVYVPALAFNLAALPFFVKVAGLPPLLAQLVVVAITTVATYIAHSKFTFRVPLAVGVADEETEKRVEGDSESGPADSADPVGSASDPRESDDS